MLKRVFGGIIFLFISCTLWSQSKQIRFKRLTIDDGLSLSSVYCIFQDSKGFMWFGTEDGLNRYDGRNFRIYRPKTNNQNSLSYKWVDQIHEDIKGNLWFGSRAGITHYNPKREFFTQFTKNSRKEHQITNDTVSTILEENQFLWVGTLNGLNRINLESLEAKEIKTTGNINQQITRVNALSLDKNGNIWIGSTNGLFLYNNQSGKCEKISISSDGTEHLNIWSIVVDSNKVWIGTANGLVCYDNENKSSKHILIPPNQGESIPSQHIEKLFIDGQNRFWVNNENGLYQFETEKNRFTSVIQYADVSNSQSINPTKPIIEDRFGNIWYGTFGAGVYKIEKNGNVQNYRNNPAVQTSLSYNSIHSLYEDRAGTVWFGTFGAGLSLYDPQSNKFELLTNDPNNSNSLSTNFVWSIFEAKDNSVWIGTNSNGISRYFPSQGRYVHYTADNNHPNTLSNPTIRYIYQDRKENIWIATDGGGLNKFIESSGSFKHFRHNPNNNSSISNDFIRGIVEDENGMLWVGTRNGLNKFNPQTEQFTRYLNISEDSTSISHNYIYTGIIQDKLGNLWIGTIGGGLNKMNIKTGQFKTFKNEPNNTKSISDNMVFWIYEDEKGFIWLGTNSGLNKLDTEKEEFTRFGLNEGLPNEVVYGVLPDNNNNIWLSTNHGISKFNLSNYSTVNYDVNDGLQSNEFNGGALHKGYSGKLYFGGIYGLNIIDPNLKSNNQNSSELAITKFEIFGQEVKVLNPDSITSKNKENKIIEIDNNYFLTESVSYTDSITLDYSNNFFSIEFSALNTSLPKKVQYAYMMENLDKGWNFSKNRNFVSYARLKPGKYVFKVKAQNTDGEWSKSSIALHIQINPPFWQKWWFNLLVILVGFNLIMLIYRFLIKTKTNKLLKEQNEKITITNKRLSESERNLKELNATKDKFFSIISHDLKNPFTSLLSMSESVSQGFKDIDDEDKQLVFNKIYGSVKHIYSLLNNLLTWSRSQSERISFEPTNFNLSQLIDINVNLNRLPAEKKGIKIQIEYEQNIMAYADRQMIDTVIRNLANNALKFTNTGGVVRIICRQSGEYILVSIHDDGIGISKENLKKLFRIDLKFKATGTAGEKGTGLGLILCKEFVEKNKGEIEVESKLGEGSIFSFTLPIAIK